MIPGTPDAAPIYPLAQVDNAQGPLGSLAERWREAQGAAALSAIEGQENFEALQRFLITVEAVNKERRLLRSIYLAQKPGTN